MEIFVSYGESLTPHFGASAAARGLGDLREPVPRESRGLLRREISERIGTLPEMKTT